MSFDNSIDINNWNATVDGINDIAQSWFIILHTIKGSDPLRPAFGSGVFEYIDKPVNQFEGEFVAKIISDLERWEKRATISKVIRKITTSGVSVSIYGTYTATNTSFLVSIDLNDLASADLTTLRKSYSDSYQVEAYN